MKKTMSTDDVTMSDRLVGLPPLVGEKPLVLILGSMPSVHSLASNFYYAHPRNRFWPLLAALLDQPLPRNVREKTLLAVRHRIAVWDTIASCVRQGSLDSAIRDVVPNDIPAFLKKYPSIQQIIVNGRKSETVLRKTWPLLWDRFEVLALPSTSPANASMSFARLEALWGEKLLPLLAP